MNYEAKYEIDSLENNLTRMTISVYKQFCSPNSSWGQPWPDKAIFNILYFSITKLTYLLVLCIPELIPWKQIELIIHNFYIIKMLSQVIGSRRLYTKEAKKKKKKKDHNQSQANNPWVHSSSLSCTETCCVRLQQHETCITKMD